jgi:proline iminopeptidase
MKKIILLFAFLVVASFLYSQKFPDSFTDGKYISVNGANLYVVTVGHGDPLLIIPGGPGGAHPGYRVFDSLAKGNQVIYFDAFGRGKSDTAKDASEYTLQRDIEDVEGLRKALRLGKINVLGHSYGGVVAQGIRDKISFECKSPDPCKYFS